MLGRQDWTGTTHMFIDTRQVNDGRALVVTVCIIGGGVAGLTIARELEAHGIDTCVLESGGFEPDDATRDLCRGDATGMAYEFADGCRARFLGGSSNCWGGWSRPLDPWDFERRDWVPHSGWPFGLAHLMPYYERAHSVLRLGPLNFDPGFWEQSIGRRDVRRIPMASGRVRDTVSQFSPPVRFGRHYRKELQRASHVRLFLHANVTALLSDRACTRISQARVQTLEGKSMTVAARVFILATGGIENARLLLASNQQMACGIGNRHDLVGRYFMDHPRMQAGRVRFAPGWTRNKLYDIKYNYQSRAVKAHGQHVAAQFALTPKRWPANVYSMRAFASVPNFRARAVRVHVRCFAASRRCCTRTSRAGAGAKKQARCCATRSTPFCMVSRACSIRAS